MTTNIMPGCEPFSASGGRDGVLVLHGFTGNPQSMRPLAEAIANAGIDVDAEIERAAAEGVENFEPDAVDEFAGIDATLVGERLTFKRVVDARNVLERETWQSAGFTYRGVGR